MISKILTTPEEMEQAYRLRHEVFVDRLHWVHGNPERLETDRYDDHSTHVGIFDNDELVGYCRVIPWSRPWMLTGVFDWYKGPIDSNSVELSRLALDVSVPNQCALLAKLLYETSKYFNCKWVYTETTHRRVPVYRRMGIVFEELDRHLYDEWAVVIKIDVKGTPWRAIKERYERCTTVST